jgi:alpha-D-xyloside xylohydrolase
MSELKYEELFPGVWRIRFGNPEEFTPSTFRWADARACAVAFDGGLEQFPLEICNSTFHTNARGCRLEIPMDADERLYGLGLNTGLFDKTNRRLYVRPSDHPEKTSNDSHAPVPFFVSTRGYGVYVDTSRYATFYTGNAVPLRVNIDSERRGVATSTAELYQAREIRNKTMLIDIPTAQGVDVYLFAGPSMLDAVSRYVMFSGGGPVPPLWGLGIQYRGDGAFGAEESLALARDFRENHIPCDVWGLEPGWQTRKYPCSFLWNTDRFPDPDRYAEKMRRMGYRVSVWQHAFTDPRSPIYDALLTHAGDYKVFKTGLVPDFADPKTRDIFAEHQAEVLYSKKGIECVKLDECDNEPDVVKTWSFPEASTFPSGLDGEQMHSLFGLLYQQTMLAPLEGMNKRTWGLVRNSHALASPLPYVLYSDSYDHRCYVRGLVNEGFSGLMWTPEVRETESVEELYRRVQSAIFSPQVLINSWYLLIPPWKQIQTDANRRMELMPEHEEATKVIRSLFELRMSLIPYLYSAFNDYYNCGVPPIRALVLDYPEDESTYAVDDQFMFGNLLMVAPIFTGQESRSVYLPEGDWYDFWTDEKYSGSQTIEIGKPLDQIPVFVKGDSILPLAEPVEFVEDGTVFDLTMRVYSDSPNPFTLYEDDGVTLDYRNGSQNCVVLSWRNESGVIHKSGDYTGPQRYKFRAWTRVS